MGPRAAGAAQHSTAPEFYEFFPINAIHLVRVVLLGLDVVGRRELRGRYTLINEVSEMNNITMTEVNVHNFKIWQCRKASNQWTLHYSTIIDLLQKLASLSSLKSWYSYVGLFPLFQKTEIWRLGERCRIPQCNNNAESIESNRATGYGINGNSLLSLAYPYERYWTQVSGTAVPYNN